MPAGTKVGVAGNVPPLSGEFTFAQETAATDMLTLTGAGSQTGAFIVAQTNGAVERFKVGSGGAISLTSGAAGDNLLKITQAATPTGDAVQVLTSAAAKVFSVNSAGMVRTMILTTIATASMASNASQTIALTGVTTNDAIVAAFSSAPTVNEAMPRFVANAADKIAAYGSGTTHTAATFYIWYFKAV